MNKFERDEKIAELETAHKNNEEKVDNYRKSINDLLNENNKIKSQIEKLKEAPFESANMKIIEITDDYINFNNNYTITYSMPYSDWARNYADFEQLKDTGVENITFKYIEFEKVKDSGFRFGDDRFKVFVPCYSDQNGYYSTDLDIYLNDKKVLELDHLEVL